MEEAGKPDAAGPTYNRTLLLFAAIAGSLVGYDTGVISGTLVQLRREFSLEDWHAEWVVSSTVLASAFAALGTIPLVEQLGRRPTIVIGAMVAVISSLVIACAQGFVMLLVGRLLLGVGIGICTSPGAMYVSELSPPSLRGVTVALTIFSIVLGQLIAGLVNGGLFYVADGWRYAIGFAAALGLLLVFVVLQLPESPRWLYLRGHVDAAREAARRAGSGDFERMSASLEDERRAHGSTDSSVAGMLSMLRTLWSEAPLRRAALLGVLLMALNQLSGINTIMYYSTTIFEASHGREAAVWLAALCDAAQLLGVLLSLTTIDTHGRRLTALRSTACVALSLLGLAASYAAIGDPRSPALRSLSLAFILLYLLSFGAGLSAVASVVVSEIYPMRVRAAAVAQAAFVQGLCNYLVSQTFLSLSGAVGYSGSFASYALVATLGWGLLYRYLPETNGARLEEVEALFVDPYPQGVGRAPPQKATESTALLE